MSIRIHCQGDDAQVTVSASQFNQLTEEGIVERRENPVSPGFYYGHFNHESGRLILHMRNSGMGEPESIEKPEAPKPPDPPKPPVVDQPKPPAPKPTGPTDRELLEEIYRNVTRKVMRKWGL